MKNIKKIIVIFFILLLISSLIYLNIILNKKKNKFTPIISKCPDYWSLGKLPKKFEHFNELVYYCKNDKKLGTCDNYKKGAFLLNKNNTFFKNINIDCINKKEFNGCNITWDGITNNNNIKC